MNNEQEGEINKWTNPNAWKHQMLLITESSRRVPKNTAPLAGYENMDWGMGAQLERGMPRGGSDERDDISYSWVRVHQKGPWDLCGWEFHSQIIKPWQRNVLEAT